jgi:hypothetical protein
VHQTADEIQTLVESACKETVDNLKRIHLLGGSASPSPRRSLKRHFHGLEC